MIQANFEQLELNEDKVDGKRGFSKCGFANTRGSTCNETMRITTADRVARRDIVFTVAKERAFV